MILMLPLLYEERNGGRSRGVAREFYDSLSLDRQVVSTGTCVILKPAT
jgi:hypothetical protein